MTTSSTEFAPATNVCAENSDRRMRSRGRRDRTKARERLREEVRAFDDFRALRGAGPSRRPTNERRQEECTPS